jgi:hypothetical protein
LSPSLKLPEEPETKPKRFIYEEIAICGLPSLKLRQASCACGEMRSANELRTGEIVDDSDKIKSISPDTNNFMPIDDE